MRKRDHVIPLRLSSKEFRYLQKQVDASGLPREEYLRSLIRGKEIHARPCTHHADLLRKVTGLRTGATAERQRNWGVSKAGPSGASHRPSRFAQQTGGVLRRQAAGLCNNANQLAHTANSTGTAGPESVKRMTEMVRQVYEEVMEKW